MTRFVREYPLFHLVMFFLLAVLTYGTALRLTAHAANAPAPSAVAARALADGQGQMSLHIADPGSDVGPGSDEAAVARHP